MVDFGVMTGVKFFTLMAPSTETVDLMLLAAAPTTLVKSASLPGRFHMAKLLMEVGTDSR